MLCVSALLAGSAAPAIKNMAVIASAGSKLQDVPLAELAKLCKGAQKTWADGRNFTLVMKDPESPDMHVAVQKLFGMPGGEVKSAIAKLNEAGNAYSGSGNFDVYDVQGNVILSGTFTIQATRIQVETP